MTEPLRCPRCRKRRPTEAEVDRIYRENDTAAWRAMNACCNPECRGQWGTGCWCCHHPDYIARDLASIVIDWAKLHAEKYYEPMRWDDRWAAKMRGANFLIGFPTWNEWYNVPPATGLAWALVLKSRARADNLHGLHHTAELPLAGLRRPDKLRAELAVLSDRLQAEGHPVGEWLALYQARWIHGHTDGIGAAVDWLTGP